MSGELNGKRIALLAADGVEQVELDEPRKAVEQAGAETVVVSINSGEIQAFNHLDPGDKIKVDVTADSTDSTQFDALLLPGGVANPDKLRLVPEAIAFVQAIAAAGKPVAAICHGQWTLIDAGVVAGKSLTSWPSLQADISNAGGDWHDEQVMLCSAMGFDLVTSRKPDDLDAFNAQLVPVFAQAH